MKRSALFASPLALGMGVQVQPTPLRVRTLPEGSFGLGGVVKASHIEVRDGVPVKVIDEFDVHYVSTNTPPWRPAHANGWGTRSPRP